MADNVVARATVELEVEDRKLKAGLNKAERDTKSFASKATAGFNRASKAVSAIAERLGSLAGPAAAAAAAVIGIVEALLAAERQTKEFERSLRSAVNVANKDLTDALGRAVDGYERLQQTTEAFNQQQQEIENSIGSLRAFADLALGWADSYDTVTEAAEKAAEAQNKIAAAAARAGRADAQRRRQEAEEEAQRIAEEERAKEEAQAKELARIEERRLAEERAIADRAEKQRLADEERERRIMEQIERERQARIASVRDTFAEIASANEDALGLDRLVTELQLVGDRIEQAITRRSR